MNRDQARTLIMDVLAEVAPEIDPASIDDGMDLTRQLDLDSIDYLNWMIGIGERGGVEIPHWAVEHFLTIDGATAYLANATAAS